MTKDKPVVLGGDKIIFENIRSCCPLIHADVLSSGLKDALNDILQSGMLSNFAKYTRKLENRLCEILRVKHALTVANGTTGLEILLSTLPRDTEVLVPSYTFPSTVHAIALAHLKPKFVDIDRATYNISLQEVKLKISRNTSAILAVNTFGNPCHLKELEEKAQAYKIRLFFDSAAAIGSKYQGRFLGSFGDAEIFSLSGTKVVTAGEGGVVTTNNDDLAKELDCKRNFGYNKIGKDCLYVGFNGKLSELNAVIGLWSLRDLERNLAARRKIAAHYDEHLKNIPGIQFQQILDGCEMNYCSFAVSINPVEFGLDALVLQDCLRAEGVETLRYFCPPMHKTKAYRDFNHLRLEGSEILSQRNLCLPMHSHLTLEQADQVCLAIARIQQYAAQINQKRFEPHLKKSAYRPERKAFSSALSLQGV